MNELESILEAHGDSEKVSKLSIEVISMDRNEESEHNPKLVQEYVLIKRRYGVTELSRKHAFSLCAK